MVDEDKVACRTVAERGYKTGMWPESYITWDFLKEHPKAMEPGYLRLNWNHIPSMYCRKTYLRSLVIEQEEWDCLSDPVYLAHYWEPTQEPGDFHRTFALVLCCQSKLFPDIYFDQYSNHFTMMHVSGAHYNVGHLQKYVGALLHNAYEAGGKSKSPKAKLPLAFLDSNI